ncbi:hypothetical protein NDU88_002697 [Pleurodeles waltl]|uniref:Uncharacterized protein n=1 Tax=Pleurodeles waltl TaxID=8319 RepID=A0AAV7M4P5_PLEWA|nr:hypothetical protein NDU88_002697 [Pleurodeles waltl]
MVGTVVATFSLIALMGYDENIAKPLRPFTAIALLLARRETALHWGSGTLPIMRLWLQSLKYCDRTSEIYASLQPPTSRPKDIWQPLRDYTLTLDDFVMRGDPASEHTAAHDVRISGSETSPMTDSLNSQ